MAVFSNCMSQIPVKRWAKWLTGVPHLLLCSGQILLSGPQVCCQSQNRLIYTGHLPHTQLLLYMNTYQTLSKIPKYVVRCTSSCSVSCLQSFCWMSQLSSAALESRRSLWCSASCSSRCSLETVDCSSTSCPNTCTETEMQSFLI